MNHPPATAFHTDLAKKFEGDLRFDPYSKILYSTDAGIYQIEPLGVGLPRHADDVQYAVEVCARHGVPIIARGGGSGLAGQAVGRGFILDLSKHLTRIIEVNPHERYAVVEPGVVCDALNKMLIRHGLMYGCDPASANRATFGGIVANNATGARSILYGMTADHVVGARVILADGTVAELSETAAPAQLRASLAALARRHAESIREYFPRTWRRASGYSLNYLLPHTASQPPGWSPHYAPLNSLSRGYPPTAGGNIAKLLAGSEGTLAVLTQVKLNLVPRPSHTALCILHFESVAQAAAATPAILQTHPSAVELLDKMLINLTRSVPAYGRMLTWVRGHPGAVLVVEYYGESEGELLDKMQRLEALSLSGDSTRALTAEEQSRVWGVRKAGLGLLMSMAGDSKPMPFIEDVAVPVPVLAEFVTELDRIFQEEGVVSGYYAHASAGCLHIRPSLNLKAQSDIERMKRVAAATVQLTRRLGGAMSGEHGDGLSRTGWNRLLFGAEVYSAFEEVKSIFDPLNILNPGKVVGDHPPDTDLRYGAAYRTATIATHLSFEAQGGLAGAVEQCNGAGVCRKADGVMCPSFIATREEEHSTRGRANALRAALSGKLPAGALTSRRMHAVLDLCLECKACKAECPSGVDMAKIKYEFLAHYQSANGVPLRSLAFANIHRLLRLATPIAPLINMAQSSRVGKWIASAALHLTPHRTLPAIAPQTFRRQAALPTASHPAQLPPSAVVLFDDTFTQFNAPPVGLAAVRVLRAAGYTPVLVDRVCCGRPMISKGLLEDAARHARANVQTLAPFARAGVPIVGLEPSCMLTFRDEYLDLVPASADAREVAQHTQLIEEFVSRNVERFEPLFASAALKEVALHGHCYQKANGTSGALAPMLRLAQCDVREIDSGCCGMAGAFGYEAEHYDLSMRIGEDRLFPAVRQLEGGAVVSASGVSCRHQIADGTGRAVLHPVEVLAAQLP